MRSIVNLVIVMALATQVSHAAWLFNDIGKPDDNTLPWMGWVFALSLEASIFVFTIYSRKRVATFFAVVSTLVNLLYYWIEVSTSHRFFAMLVISPIIPITIYYYSELVAMLRAKEEEDAQPIGGYYSTPVEEERSPAPEPAPPTQTVRNEPEVQVAVKPVGDGSIRRPKPVVPKEPPAARVQAQAADDWQILDEAAQDWRDSGKPMTGI